MAVRDQISIALALVLSLFFRLHIRVSSCFAAISAITLKNGCFTFTPCSISYSIGHSQRKLLSLVRKSFPLSWCNLTLVFAKEPVVSNCFLVCWREVQFWVCFSTRNLYHFQSIRRLFYNCFQLVSLFLSCFFISLWLFLHFFHYFLPLTSRHPQSPFHRWFLSRLLLFKV